MRHNCFRIFWLLLTVFFTVQLSAQETDFATLVPEEGTRPPTFEDYLVQVAWMNNQTKNIIETRQGITDEEIKLAKKQWLRSIQLSASLSPRDTTALFNLPPGVPEGTIIPPFLNFGVGWSIGDLFLQKNNVRIKKQEKEIYDFELNQEKLLVRRQVLVAYQKYLISIEVLKARQKAAEDAETNYQLISEKFRKDKAKFEEANQASISYHDAIEKKLVAETDIQLARLTLEEILGTKWKTVEAAKARYSVSKRRRN